MRFRGQQHCIDFEIVHHTLRALGADFEFSLSESA
jgi:hypothetical protein